MNELFEQMSKHWNEFVENHTKFTEKGTASSARKARKCIGELKKLVTDYRKQSVELGKQA